MKILGIETSTKIGSVALIHDDILLCEYIHGYTAGHSSWVISAIDKMLRDGGEDKLRVDGIGVSIGPGMFTGLRVGVAVAKGLSYALGVPIAGVSSLDALAWNMPYEFVCSVIDATRGEVYAALYENNKRISEYMLIKPDKLCQMIDNKNVVLVGNGVKVYEDIFLELLKDKAIVAPLQLAYPRALNVAAIGLNTIKAGLGVHPEEIIPMYLRCSDAEANKNK